MNMNIEAPDLFRPYIKTFQKCIKVKDCVIKRLHEELVDLRGPLPESENANDSVNSGVQAIMESGNESGAVDDDIRSVLCTLEQRKD